MKRLAVMVIALVFAGCGDDDGPTGPSTVGPIVFGSQLSATSEVPPVTGPEAGGRGSVTITLTVPRDVTGSPSGSGTVTFAMQAQGFAAGTPVVAAHIHPGAAGVNNNFIVNTGLSPTAPMLLADGTGNLIVTSVPISQEVAAQIAANPGAFYFNMHTALNPGGAIRGQLARVQ